MADQVGHDVSPQRRRILPVCFLQRYILPYFESENNNPRNIYLSVPPRVSQQLCNWWKVTFWSTLKIIFTWNLVWGVTYWKTRYSCERLHLIIIPVYGGLWTFARMFIDCRLHYFNLSVISSTSYRSPSTVTAMFTIMLRISAMHSHICLFKYSFLDSTCWLGELSPVSSESLSVGLFFATFSFGRRILSTWSFVGDFIRIG